MTTQEIIEKGSFVKNKKNPSFSELKLKIKREYNLYHLDISENDVKCFLKNYL